MKMFSMQNSSIVKQVIDNFEFEKAGPKQYLSQAEVDVLAFMGDELDQHGRGKDRSQMGSMAKAIIDAKAVEDIERAEDAKANGGDISKCNTMIEKANKLLSTHLSSKWIRKAFDARTAAIASSRRKKSFVSDTCATIGKRAGNTPKAERSRKYTQASLHVPEAVQYIVWINHEWKYYCRTGSAGTRAETEKDRSCRQGNSDTQQESSTSCQQR